MKDPQIVYKERLENILNLIKDDQYSNCFKISQNLTIFVWTMELEDKVFTSKVLESIFNQINDVISNYILSEAIAQQLQTNFGTKMENLIKAYSDRDPQQLYICLKELRYVVTYNQLYICQNHPRNKSNQFQRVIS